MSFSQQYSVPSTEELLEQLTNKTAYNLLAKELEAQGIMIEKTEDVILNSDFSGVVKAQRVFLSDGRVYEPRLVRCETAAGNWGNDIYEYRLRGQQVEVERVDLTDLAYSEDPYYGGVDSWLSEGGCGNDEGC